MARRPRRNTLIIGGPQEKTRSQTPDRVRVTTRDAVELSVPQAFAAHRDRIVAIVTAVNATPSESHEKLQQYLTALSNDVQLRERYHTEVAAARTMLGGIMGGNWKDIVAACKKHEILLPMLSSLNN